MADGGSMQPNSKQSQPSSAPAQPQNSGAEDDAKGKKPAVKKRTKTGCLTCRKRRIKCDETKPRCKNCIKSKRPCEGYTQRVVFKDPANLGTTHGHFGPAIYPPGTRHQGASVGLHSNQASSQNSLQPIAPRPAIFNGSHRQPVSFAQAHSSHSSLSNYPPIPNPLLGPDAAHLTHSYYMASSHGEIPPDALGQEQTSRVEQLGAPFEQDLPPSQGYGPPDRTQYGHGVIEDEVAMDESDDENPDPQSLVVRDYRDVLKPYARGGTEVRTFSAFAQNYALSEYMDYVHSSELRRHDMQTIFRHFVSVTGPTMSLYERDPTSLTSGARFDGDATLDNNLWSHTFPLLSFHHPGLFHAIMAIASLQIANLQNTPATAALRHYHISLRRNARNVSSPQINTKPTTVATTLLLAYFEVWSSDHTKWCNHLLGGRLLFRQIPLRQMSRICLPVKRMRHFPSPLSATPSIGPRRDPADLDYGLLSTITGRRVTAEDYGLQEGQLLDEECLWTTDKDIETYDTLRDLFWWYAKMDVYQSMLGGTKLFMEYEHWTQCPPRAPVSSTNSIFGTYDHLILLLGRLASFTSKDLSRKRKVFRAKGGGSFRGGSSPSQFPGIVPTLGKFHAPIGFSAQSSYSDDSDSPGDTATPESNELAEQEWESIRQAFETFESRLDARFKPLNSEYADHKDTPFGTALHYRTYSVAGIWMNYYMGLIHLYRSRPNMPPAAMQAAGMAAPSTAGYAIQIGRIAAGLTDNCSTKKDISTTLAAALIESSFCLFVAAVQLQDNNQRCWVIQRVFDIARLTGWQTARKIAIGCESAWIKVAQLGHGPEYKRPQHLEEVPVSIWMNPRKLDQRIQDMQNTTETRLVLHRSEQTNLALGLLGVETDLEVLDLREDR
ncbi:Zn(2)-C6 fungal-type DNA-binding domain protein [Metarhizium album ARSEF 1941]|uniref:Zn(2)-C6 fungal-type DNA-binding domain protein n=1 Tax=Metarhizium album (strain ARSEF 1941) TaxID=1081103 RepID=A0A0B2WZ64_METAS|nr:Zn(2)-C6 fungal-type DNA-binding domain protein [Metarhizium album ARSEF 1941]KHN98150.1 Zn(2)-C6 fungal-type DNA-binding domain protein [Metarhizium album ARSEF 1941]